MATSGDRDEYYSLKYPVFKERTDWIYYKTKIMAYLLQKECLEVLELSGMVLAETRVWTTLEEADGTAEEGRLLQKQN